MNILATFQPLLLIVFLLFASWVAGQILNFLYRSLKENRKEQIRAVLYKNRILSQKTIEDSESVDELAERWFYIPLSYRRKTALIKAGIQPEDALLEETQKLTSEELRTLSFLNHTHSTR